MSLNNNNILHSLYDISVNSQLFGVFVVTLNFKGMLSLFRLVYISLRRLALTDNNQD